MDENMNNQNANNDATQVSGAEDSSTSDLIIKFNKPYEFEGQTYNEIDLSDVENISTKDLIEVDKLFYQSGNLAPTSEMSMAYACLVASKAAKKPVEFFNKLPGREGIKIKTQVVSFLYN